jgi:arsenate reductase-like glutaredoxin family protein
MANSEFKFPDEVENKEPDIEVRTEAEADVEIDIVDDTPERDRGRKPLEREVNDPTDEELDTYTEGVKKRLKELTHARHDERRAKEALAREKAELERLAQAMVEENKRLKQFVQSGTEQYVTMANQAAEAKLEKARRDLKAAQEAFDTDAIIAAQEALAEAKWESQNTKNMRAPTLQPPQEDVQSQQPQPQQVRADEKTLRWQAKNQWFGSPGFEEITSYALGLHQKLVNNGVDPRTDEYFEQIDARVKSKFPEIFGGEDDKPRSQAAAPARKPASVVAPASRSTGKRRIELTPSQAALVKKFNLDPQMYAQEILKLENQNG